MLRLAVKHWLLALFAVGILAGCESIDADADGNTSLVGAWVRTDGPAEETMTFAKDGTVVLDSIDLGGGLRYSGTWVASAASGTVVWKESSTQMAGGTWSVSKPLLGLIRCPFVLKAGELVQTYPEGERRFARMDSASSSAIR